MPAPLTVTLFRIRWLHPIPQPLVLPGILKVPSGIHTVPPGPAAVIAELNAAVESAAPVGSAPLLATEIEPAGWARAPVAFSKAGESIVYEEAVPSASTCSRNFVPAG